MLGSDVLWFQAEDPAAWRAAEVASVTTHDLPTAAGFLAEEHVRVRAELDQLAVPLEQEHERVRRERVALLEMLQRTGLLDSVGGDPVLAMHAALAASPAQVVLAWQIGLGSAPIPRSTKAERLAENLASHLVQLEPDEFEAMEALETGHRCGPDPRTFA